ncbi:hypothetical protein Cgig2_031279 [Carnegiea gigantea]|uniref:C2H2-type domain-containing protein n=1 Tax=Carnegiea gigantea TaxID=171969 RepID=A0A9Q1KJB6_9CARY|nr:hypothetical protein Cgig2_031279 [Carnegiea gigantea]
MEQLPYWMLKKRVHDDQYLDDSWEERAFAEDAAGLLGGGVWPPRSYTCTFCKREFRSAQALGGHMNVHRRDRARLKQFSSATPNDQILDPSQNSAYFCKDLITSCPSLMVTYPTQNNYALVHDGNPNPKSNHPTLVSIPHKMSTPISQENKIISKQILNPHIASYFVLNHEKKYPSFTSPDDEFVSKNKELGCKYDKHHERSSLSINLVFQKSFPTTIAADDQEDKAKLRKRRKLKGSPQPVIPTISGARMVDDGLSKSYGMVSWLPRRMQ